MLKLLKNKQLLLLIFVVFIAALLRFCQLGINPPSLTWDEVAWGYNAYSLGIDGKDEFGRFLPFDYLESFGDFKPPMYAYLDVIPVKLFGLNEFATRFPSALFGVLTVFLTYFLTKEIFWKAKAKDCLALAAAALLAISPWHIMLSRAAFEANVATFFLILGVYLFLRGVQKNSWFLSLSALSFVASMYTFNTSRVVAPLLVVMLAIGFLKKLLVYKKQTMAAIVVGLIFLLPVVPFLLSPQAALRFKEVNIFTDIDVVKMANQEIANDGNAWWSKALHNRRLAYGVQYIKHYFDNLSFHFLFVKGDGNPKFSTQEVGQMYLWELPLFIAGILFLIRKREGHWWIIPAWLLLAIIPAATARETPHALRIEATLPTFQILVGYGIMQAYDLIIRSSNRKVFKSVVVTLFLLMVSFGTVYFWENYSQHYAKEFAGEWQYGYKDAVLYSESVMDKYNGIYLTKELGRPYIYVLFYGKYDPHLFRAQGEVDRDAFGFVAVKNFDKYRFDKDGFTRENGKNVLRIVTPWNVPKEASVKKTFYLPNGQAALVGYVD